MKKLIYITLALIGFASCDEFTDVEPKGEVLPRTVEDYQGLLQDFNSIGLAPISYIFANDDIHIPDDMLQTFEPWSLRAYKWEDYQFNADETDFTWAQAYKEIFNCNVVLNNIDDAEGDDAIRTLAKAEASFFRGFTNFQLVNMYAKTYDAASAGTDMGIPLVKEEQILQKLPRANVKEVYESIVEDITNSVKGLPLVSNAETQFKSFHPVKAAAYGMLSRVHLFMGNYDKAIEAGEEFFNLQTYNSILDMNVPGYMPYNIMNPEHLFFQMPAVGGDFEFMGGTYLSDELVSHFDAGKDMRLMFYTRPENGKLAWTGTSMSTPDPGVSSPEVLLNLAEAYARKDNKQKTIELVNHLQAKRHMAASYVALNEADFTAEEALVEVLKERRRELFFNGKRFFDLKRLNKEDRFKKTITRTIEGNTINIAPGDNKYQFALPRDIVALNSKLIQNPR